MKNWKRMLSLVLCASCMMPVSTVSMFAQEQTDSLTDLPTDSVETPDEGDDSSSDTDSEDKPGNEVDATVYDWYKDPKTVYEVKLYQDDLAKLTSKDETEQQAIRQEQERSAKFLEDHEYVEMHRLYNPNSGEHFYTSDEDEFSYLVQAGWNDEGIGWLAPLSGGKEVYRLYNPNGDHHYTMDANERDFLVSAGWNDEGIGWFSADEEDAPNTLPVYRQYNPNQFMNNHNYSTDAREHRMLTQKLGWNDENIGWYAISPVSVVEQSDHTFKVYDNKTMEQLEGEQKVGGQVMILDPKNDGKSVIGLYKTEDSVYLYDENGFQSYGLKEYGGDTYLFDIDTGKATVGDYLMDENGENPRYVTFDEEGRMLKGVTVNGIKYDQDGTKLTLTPDESLMLECLAVYRDAGRELRDIYDWTWNTIRYIPSDKEKDVPSDMTALQHLATLGFTDRSGSAAVFAATFGTLAKNLGYDVQVISGELRTQSGWSDHSWVKIKLDGNEYIFDPMLERALKGDGNLCWMQNAERPKYQYKEGFVQE